LRTHFPEVPILALTATCPPRVLEDILKILQLKPVTPGNSQIVFLFRFGMRAEVHA
jgi:ATP-dependent DNA helicase Q1